jgi:hypothetical protein
MCTNVAPPSSDFRQTGVDAGVPSMIVTHWAPQIVDSASRTMDARIEALACLHGVDVAVAYDGRRVLVKR